jgi:hypothetical protein|tara:strand:- start:3104 stop:3421 length:318 start_codon:yes stop_codon:yes gene_type:complete
MSSLSKIMPSRITDSMISAGQRQVGDTKAGYDMARIYKAFFDAHGDDDLAGKIRAVTKAVSVWKTMVEDIDLWEAESQAKLQQAELKLDETLTKLRSHIFSEEWL